MNELYKTSASNSTKDEILVLQFNDATKNRSLRAIEGTRSELQAANRFINTLETQKLSLQNDLNQLYGLTHPIRRCPSDILQHIFESTVKTKGLSRLRSATTLSHVCRRWRDIALQTPYLWSKFHLSQGDDPKEVKSFLERTVERVKSAGTTVLINDCDVTDVEWEAVKQWPINQIPHIERLHFQIKRDRTAIRLGSGSWSLYTGRLDHLDVLCKQEGNLRIDIASISNKFPSVSSVTLHGSCVVTFRPSVAVLSVTMLTILGVSDISLDNLSQAFPNAENVALISVSFSTHTGGDIYWPKLQSLSNISSTNIPWPDLKVRGITNFTNWSAVDGTVLAFIASHPSINRLDIEPCGETMRTIMGNAPNLFSLHTMPCDEICNPSLMNLTKLPNLGLYHLKGNPIPVDLFEKILRSRFPPQNESRNSPKNGLLIPSLTILVEPGVHVEDLEWRKSELLLSVVEEISVYKRCQVIYNSHWFRWR